MLGLPEAEHQAPDRRLHRERARVREPRAADARAFVWQQRVEPARVEVQGHQGGSELRGAVEEGGRTGVLEGRGRADSGAFAADEGAGLEGRGGLG